MISPWPSAVRTGASPLSALLPSLVCLAGVLVGCDEAKPGAASAPDTGTAAACVAPRELCAGECLPPCPADMARDAACQCWGPMAPLPVGPTRVDATLCLSASVPGGNSEGAQKRRSWFFEALEELGIAKLRAHFVWHGVEPAQGKFSWGHTDLQVAECRAHGIELVGLLAYGNKWASKAGKEHNDNYYPPDDPADFANYAAAVVGRYRDDVHLWEVWNEQNSGFRFWKGTGGLGGDAGAYGALLRATYKAVKAVDPDATVGYGGLFYLPQLIPGAIEFTAASLAAWPDLGAHFDAYAWHPYAPYPPMAAPEEAGDPNSEVLQPVPADETARRVVKLLTSEGKGEAPLWVTELGWPTEKAITEAQAAAYLVRSYVLLLSERVELLCWYTLMDSAPDHKSIAFWEKVFGMYRWADTAKGETPLAKDTVKAHQVLHAQLGPLRYAVDRSGAKAAQRPPRHHVFANEAGRLVHVLWDPAMTVDEVGPAAFPARPGATYSGVTALGAQLPVSVDAEHQVRVNIGGGPVYVVELPALR